MPALWLCTLTTNDDVGHTYKRHGHAAHSAAFGDPPGGRGQGPRKRCLPSADPPGQPLWQFRLSARETRLEQTRALQAAIRTAVLIRLTPLRRDATSLCMPAARVAEAYLLFALYGYVHATDASVVVSDAASPAS